MQKIPSYGGTLISNVISYGDWPLFVASLKRVNTRSSSYYSYSSYSSSLRNSFEIHIMVIDSALAVYVIKEVYCCCITENDIQKDWVKLKSRKQGQGDGSCNLFSAKCVAQEQPFNLRFNCKLTKKAEGYEFLLMDANWSKNLMDSRFGSFTDVELLCGTKTFFAHRFVLGLRSPVLRANLGVGAASKKTKLIINEVEPAVMLNFLKFLYTGDMSQSAMEERDQLELLAKKYQVDSLIKWLSSITSVPSADNILLSALHH